MHTTSATVRSARPAADGDHDARGEKHERARARILAAAAGLFFENGYAGTTVDALARALSMTKPFVYYYFEDKAKIYETLCLNAADATLSSFDFARRSDLDTVSLLREGLRRLALANMEHFETSSLYYREPQALAAPVRTQILDRARAFNRRLRTLIERGQREGVLAPVDSGVAALSIAGMVGFMYRWYDPAGPRSRDEMADELARAMLRVAGLPTPAPDRPAQAPSAATRGPRARTPRRSI